MIAGVHSHHRCQFMNVHCTWCSWCTWCTWCTWLFAVRLMDALRRTGKCFWECGSKLCSLCAGEPPISLIKEGRLGRSPCPGALPLTQSAVDACARCLGAACDAPVCRQAPFQGFSTSVFHFYLFPLLLSMFSLFTGSRPYMCFPQPCLTLIVSNHRCFLQQFSTVKDLSTRNDKLHWLMFVQVGERGADKCTATGGTG